MVCRFILKATKKLTKIIPNSIELFKIDYLNCCALVQNKLVDIIKESQKRSKIKNLTKKPRVLFLFKK